MKCLMIMLHEKGLHLCQLPPILSGIPNSVLSDLLSPASASSNASATILCETRVLGRSLLAFRRRQQICPLTSWAGRPDPWLLPRPLTGEGFGGQRGNGTAIAPPYYTLLQ